MCHDFTVESTCCRDDLDDSPESSEDEDSYTLHITYIEYYSIHSVKVINHGVLLKPNISGSFMAKDAFE